MIPVEQDYTTSEGAASTIRSAPWCRPLQHEDISDLTSVMWLQRSSAAWTLAVEAPIPRHGMWGEPPRPLKSEQRS